MPGVVLQQVCESLTPLLRDKGNTLFAPNLDELPVMKSDEAKFRQICTNLLSNACKFTQDGIITVSATISARSELETGSGDQVLQLSVQDTGIGMTPEQLARIFDAFVQADSSTSASYGGTGLGLAICRDYCELLGGSITAASELGEGSTFTVRLPY